MDKQGKFDCLLRSWNCGSKIGKNITDERFRLWP